MPMPEDAPDQTDEILEDNQVLQPLTDTATGDVLWYRVTSKATGPGIRYSITLTSPVDFQYSHSADGPWQDVPAGQCGLELAMHNSPFDFYITGLNGTVSPLVGKDT